MYGIFYLISASYLPPDFPNLKTVNEMKRKNAGIIEKMK